VLSRLVNDSGAPRRAVPAWRRAAPVGVAAVTALAAGFVFWPRSPEPLGFTVGVVPRAGVSGVWLSAPAAERVPLQFSDGSRVVLEPLCRARIAETEARGAAILVESGRVAVDVVHRPEGRWRLSLGPFSVHVIGTRFGVEFDPVREALTLEVHDGRVVASGCHLGEGRPVHAGERLRASCKTRQLEIVTGETDGQRSLGSAQSPVQTDTVLPNASAKVAPESPAPAAAAEGPAPPAAKWRGLLAQGDYKGAFLAAKLAGFERECETANSSELMALGDAARFSGQPAAAEHAYLSLRRRFAGDGRAALAAFSLAKIAFDQRGEHAAAARWFETYLRESPGGPLAREALGRLMESLQRSGQAGRARDVAEQYVARHPRGPHAELARRLLDE
jgi:transmembrane sensor